MRRLVVADRHTDQCNQEGYCTVMSEVISTKSRTGLVLVDVEVGGRVVQEVRYVRGGRPELACARVYVCPFCFGSPMSKGRDTDFAERSHRLMFKKALERVLGAGLIRIIKE